MKLNDKDKKWNLVEMGDHEFVKWLHERKWSITSTTTTDDTATFRDVKGRVLAVILFNNTECTKQIFTFVD